MIFPVFGIRASATCLEKLLIILKMKMRGHKIHLLLQESVLLLSRRFEHWLILARSQQQEFPFQPGIAVTKIKIMPPDLQTTNRRITP